MIVDHFTKTQKIPKTLVKVAVSTRKVLSWIFKKNQPTNTKKTGSIKAAKKTEQVQVVDVEKQGVEHESNEMLGDKEEFDSNVSALNSLAFSLLFLVIFSCNMGIWVSIGS